MAVSKPLQEAVRKSAVFAKQTGESKIETEHLLYGMLSVNSKASQIFASFGIQANSYKKVILSYLKPKTIQSAEPVDYSKTVTSIFAKTTNFCKKTGRDLLEIEDVLYVLL